MTQRQEIEERVSDLKRARGSAVLDGKKHAEITVEIEATEAALATLDDAEGERIRRMREQEAQDAAVNLKAKVRRIGDLEARRLVAWGDAEQACRSLLEAVGRIISSTESERVLHSDITPGAVPMQLGSFETKHRVRGRIGELLHAAKVNFEVLGAGGIYSSAALEDWREAERKTLASYLEALLEETN